MRMFLSGNHAAAYGARLARPKVIAAYPITPQSPIYEKLSEWDGKGELGARMMRVESEHSAMAACISASLAGVRTFTATASQGLALMHELLHFASGMRVPVVMVNVNRALAAPWSFWSEQTDSLSQRDTGWLQFYVADNQEALDTVIQAFKVSETILLPDDGRSRGFLYLPFHGTCRGSRSGIGGPISAALCACRQIGSGTSRHLQSDRHPEPICGVSNPAPDGDGRGPKRDRRGG